MKSRSFIFTGIFLLFGIVLCISSCGKNENFIAGDAKVRYFHSSINDTTQNFFLNGIQSGATTPYGSNSNYLVVAGDSTYKITSRRIDSANVAGALVEERFAIGSHYSVFFTRKTKTDAPSLVVYKDDVAIDKNTAKLTFLNLGYTLASDIKINDEGGAFTAFTMTYGDRKTFKVPVNKTTKISFALVSPIATQPDVNTLDSVVATNAKAIAISRGKVYTVLLDGTKLGELQMRLISAN